MATYYEFDEKAIASALEATDDFYSDDILAAKSTMVDAFDDGHISLAAGCISVTVDNGRLCFNLPLGIGHVCVPVPSAFPNGTVAQACIKICKIWKIPTGVKLTVIIAGQVIVEKTFGKC